MAILVWTAAIGIPVLYDRLVRRWERFWTSEQKCPLCLFGKVARLSPNMRECANPKCGGWFVTFSGRMNNRVPTFRWLYQLVKDYVTGYDTRKPDPEPAIVNKNDCFYAWSLIVLFVCIAAVTTVEFLFFVP